MDKKGFLFTVTIFLILTYILLSISIWVKAVEASEKTYSEFYKESTIELTLNQVTSEKLSNISDVIMNRALYRLNDISIDYPLKEGPASDQNQFLRNAMFDLLVNGSANSEYFVGGGGAIIQNEPSSLNSWANSMNASLRSVGVYMDKFKVSNFQLSQVSLGTLVYSYDLSISLKDYTNSSSVSKSYHVQNALDVSGLVDPALARASKAKLGDSKTIYRAFFFQNSYTSPANIVPTKLSLQISGGQGWLYAPVASAIDNNVVNFVPSALSIPSTERSKYILVGTYDQITVLGSEVYNSFAGYIVTSLPEFKASSDCAGKFDESKTFQPVQFKKNKCDSGSISLDEKVGIPTENPFIVASGFDVSSAAVCPILENDTGNFGRCVLIQNTYLQNEVSEMPTKKQVVSGSGIYTVENTRDFIMCGYYTHNVKAPSYLQRLMENAYSKKSSNFGIETFVVGIYANDPVSKFEGKSRLDWELFNDSKTGIKIKGMPGCKSYGSCSGAGNTVTGILSTSSDTLNDYGFGDVACKGSGCGG